jgi:hypothetical protein
MEYVFLGMSVFVGSLSLYVLGQMSRYWDIKNLKEENERLNAELHKLTDRDERGRFRGGK